tara:strand:- start:94939 stop:97296 length:2358 start_codon:yes stop_codon:yes gene_type:complete
MSEKNLPIKLFEKRKEIDERRIEGGGSNTLPKFVLPVDELAERSSIFSTVIDEKISELKQRPQNREFIPSAVQIELHQDAIAKSHRSEIKTIFNVNNKSNLIGFNGENSVLVKIDNVSDAEAIQRNIRNTAKYQIGLSAITNLEDFKPEVVSEEDGAGAALKISILNYQQYELNSAVKSSFERYCQEKGIELKRANYSPELIIYRTNRTDQATIDTLEEFEAIESISFMPQYEVGIDMVESDSNLEAKTPEEGVEYPVIGVLDSGVARNKFTDPWLLKNTFSSYPEDRIDNRHGTFVSGIILYGDELENRNLTGLEGCKIFDATVIPDKTKETIYEDELIENIREAISQNSDIKIWNMSLGTNLEAHEHDFSDFGQALDNIQEVNNVLICKSAGNCTNFVKGAPKSRIAKSADSVHALVVGSIAHKKNPDDLVDINHPSPFTRIGHGPSNIIKPEVVNYGGNAHYNGQKIVRNGVKSIDPMGNIVSDVGTSFSTPRVSALLAALNLNIQENFNPLLIKALVIHSAQYPRELNMPIKERLKQVGFGLPSPVQDIIYNDEYEATLILQDTLVKGEFMEILDFPFPESLIDENGYYMGQVNLTIVSSPVLRNQGNEYCQSNIDVLFGTYDDIKQRDTNVSTILNEVGPDKSANILRDAHYNARFKKDTVSEYARERVLLNYGRKYHPIKRYTVNLAEMTNANKEDILKAPKRWILKTRGLYRDFTEEMAQQDGEELSQDYTLIITIKDPSRTKPIYNEVTQLLNNRNFNHNDINLRSEVRVNSASRGQ